MMSPVLSPLSLIAGGRSHPIVQAMGNSVRLETRSQTSYFGDIYAGSSYTLASVIYDTMSQYSVIFTSEYENGYANYAPLESDNAKPLKDSDGGEMTKTITLGSWQFSGTLYRDNFCLVQSNKNKPTPQTGRLCVNPLKFLAVDKVKVTKGDQDPQHGILGLAPDTAEESYVSTLFN